ncbi:MAG TPA: DUF2085 domain-containing protein [Aggregatilineales bacterium]|nr:DUF2085 domain-containing protein [Chloroflexota bacterium]HOA23173.1 DUF2085 domain-containing protein [Aggregatilineales bacterium]HPV08853.1 DUF2085 domain-containing protein [Aggregatilineales bacterium]HQA67500.1 DUF2085 domain-containing protein [Aggregatilineales bacterium]HQE17310.1 DUF2085 domain-containing protein [Aggregatilineales bacterium]
MSDFDTRHTNLTSHSEARPAPDSRLLWIAVVVLVVVLAVWLMLTPDGLLGKADAIGYAVCHRIDARSFHLPGGRAVPLCARCSGTFLGVMVGLFGPGVLFGRRRAAGFPPLPMIAVMLLATAWWGIDGANSFAHLLPGEGIPRLWEPTNFLRVTTGMFHGITMASLILPILNSTVWADATNEPTLDRWGQLGVLYGIGAVLIAMVYSELPVFLYPLAFLSAVGVVVILSATMTVIVTTLLGRENRARTVTEALPLFLLAVAATFVLIGGIDALRFAIFGSWDGFSI